MSEVPFRLRAAQTISRIVPLMISQRVAGKIFGWKVAGSTGIDIERRALTGSSLVVNTRDEFGFDFANTGCYDWKLWAIAFAACNPGDTIVEVGANVGTETVGFADIVGPAGRVIAFEPVPENVARLRSFVAGRAIKNVDVVDLAVSDSVGSINFVFPEGRNSGLGHIDYGDGKRPGRSFSVGTTTLDDYLNDVSARLLMMDVEGAETNVLQGGRRWIAANRPVIVCEAHHHKAEILSVLTRFNYSVHSIRRFGLDRPQPSPSIPQANWLAVHRDENSLAHRIDRMIKWCGVLPPITGIHPLVSMAAR